MGNSNDVRDSREKGYHIQDGRLTRKVLVESSSNSVETNTDSERSTCVYWVLPVSTSLVRKFAIAEEYWGERGPYMANDSVAIDSVHRSAQTTPPSQPLFEREGNISRAMYTHMALLLAEPRPASCFYENGLAHPSSSTDSRQT